VLGVSEDAQKFGHQIFKSLMTEGYSVYGINPKGGEVLNKKIYKSINEIGVIPDLVITAVKPEVTEKIIEECGKLGIKEIWMQPGSESDKAITAAKDLGMSVTHHACIMLDSGIW